MAIVEMQKLNVLVMKKDEDNLLKLLQKAGCMQFTEVDEQAPDSRHQRRTGRNEDRLNRVKWAISRLSKFDTQKQSMIAPLPAVSLDALDETKVEESMAVVTELEQIEKENGEIRGSQTRLIQQLEQIKPWQNLDLRLDELKDTTSTRVLTGHLPRKSLPLVTENWSGRAVVITQLGSDRDSVYILAIVHRQIAEDFLSDLRANGYQYAAPPQTSGTVLEKEQHYNQELLKLKENEESLRERTAGLAVHLPQLRVVFETLNAKKQRLKSLEKFAHTDTVTYLSGWVPKPAAPALADMIQKEFPGSQTLIADPEEGEEPPVLLQNNALVRPYEAVVTGFALPTPGSIDPTAVMMPFFACFFGMMVSDAGYGLMMALIIPILVKIMQPNEGLKKIFWILAGGGIATVFWGALYNTWFGFGPWPTVFDPVNDSLPVMALCIGVGAIHLFAGLGLGAAQNIKKGDWASAIYDQVSWFILVVGLGLLVLPQTAAIGKWMAIAGAGIILLTAGRDKSKNPIKRLVSGLGALYGVTSWISDLLSYMRLFGMGLATGVIGMVINQLVGMIMGGGIIGIVIGAVVFVGAHLFNAAINILGAYVHACRLQYIEFFGKFYEEGGKPFNPLRFAPRYVRIHE